MYVVWYLESLLQCLIWILPRQPTEMTRELLYKLKELKKSVLAIGSYCPPFELTRFDHRNPWKEFSRNGGIRHCDRVIVTQARMKTLDVAAVESTVDWCTAVAKFIGAKVPVHVLPDLIKVKSLVQCFLFHQKDRPVLVIHNWHRPFFCVDEPLKQVQQEFFDLFKIGLEAFDTDKTEHLDVAHKFLKVLSMEAARQLANGIRSKKVLAAYNSIRLCLAHRIFKTSAKELVQELETVNRRDIFSMLRIVFVVVHRLHMLIPEHEPRDISATIAKICDWVTIWPAHYNGIEF